jgi:hypothetical protein
MLKGERLGGSAEGLDFVDPDGHVVLFQQFDDRPKEIGMSWKIAGFTQDQLHAHDGMLFWEPCKMSA